MNLAFIQILLSMFLSFAISEANAQTKKIESIPEDIPKVVITSKGEMTILFPDGRVAIMQITEPDVHPFSFKAEVIENTCDSEFKRISCEYSVDFSPEIINFIWLKNPDPKKVGKKLIDEDGLIQPVFNPWLWELRFMNTPFFDATKASYTYHKKLTQGPRLTCSNLDWVKKLPSFNNNKLSIAEWTSEANTRNLETSLDENIIALSLMDVETQIENNSLTVTKIGFSSKGEPNAIVMLSIGDVIGWSIRDQKNNMCEISIKSDSNALVEVLGNIDGNDKFKLKFKPVNNIKKLQDIIKYLPEESISDFQESLEMFKNEEDYYRLLILNALRIYNSNVSDGKIVETYANEVE